MRFAGPAKIPDLSVRFVMEVAWQAHFVKNMFIRPSQEELASFKPDFVVVNASKTGFADYAKHGLNSETFIAFNLTEHMQIIGGSWYGGEMKKGMFSLMNYLLPRRGLPLCIVLPIWGMMGIPLFLRAFWNRKDNAFRRPRSFADR